MSDLCLNPVELAGLAFEDPRRAHVEGCPRCQAILKSLAAFMDPVEIPAEANLAEADTLLAAALEREMEVVRPAPTFWTPFRVRVLSAVAAVLVVAVGLSLFGGGPDVVPNGEPVLRGVDDSAGRFLCHFDNPTGPGDPQLSWTTFDGATEYKVVAYDLQLKELAVFEAGSETSLVLDPPLNTSFFRVIALKDGDELARSEPAYFDQC